MTIHHDQFTDEAQALEEIEHAGYHAMTLDFPAENNEPHWHDFDSMLYILEGEVTIIDTETGEECICGPGTRLRAGAGVLHREVTEGYKALIGIPIKPEELTQPINKPPPVQLE